MKKAALLFLSIFIYALIFGQKVIIPNPLKYPEPEALSSSDSAKLGALIPRTMSLLHSGKKVKIAIYGQSLSDENNRWWRDLGDAIKIAWPQADVDIRTFGVGGVASSLLWRLTNQETVAFNPDLVIFHVLGHHTFYETVVRQIRGCTTAEMMVQGDHFGRNDGSGQAGSWDYNLSDMSQWDNNMSFQIVKGYCDKYKLERDNRRVEWYDYLRANAYIPGQLLKDDIHFNDQGQWLTASLAARHFVYKEDRNTDPDGLVKYYEAGTDFQVENGKIIFPFEGNKVEIVPSSKGGAVISATIDGKNPSEFANCYYFTIPAGGFWAGAPFIKPGMGTPQNEEWTLNMTGGGNFSLLGSETGPDGSGNKDNVFISDSKRVIFLNKNDWGNYGSPKNEGQYSFSSRGMFNEEIDFDTITLDELKENEINIVQGLENKVHTLELKSSSGNFPIKYIKVFKPSYKLSIDVPDVIIAPDAGGTVTIPVKSNTFWQASHNSNRLGSLSKWNNLQLQNGEDYAIDDNKVNITVSVPALTGSNATEFIYIYGQGCDVKTVEIRQGVFNTGIPVLKEKKLSVFPNPVKDLLTIVNLNDSALISVYELNGTLVSQEKTSETGIDLHSLLPGSYLLKIETQNAIFNEVIIKE